MQMARVTVWYSNMCTSDSELIKLISDCPLSSSKSERRKR